jgi:hypothetical protein
MKTLLEHITEEFMREESQAAQQAKQMGLISKGWGRWADPRTGKVTHKTDGDRLVPVDPKQQEPTSEPTSEPKTSPEPDLDSVAKDLKTLKKSKARKTSPVQSAKILAKNKEGILNIWDEPDLSAKEIKQAEDELGIDVARALSDPFALAYVTGDDWSWAGDEETQKEKIIGYLKDQLYYWVRPAGENSQGVVYRRDQATGVGQLQLAFPSANKNMSDEEHRQALKQQLENPTSVSGELNNIMRKSKASSAERVQVKKDTIRRQYSEWVEKQDSSYDSEVRGWQMNMDREALQALDERMKKTPPSPIKSKEPVYRGMAMNDADLKEFLTQFKGGSTVDFPISAFTFEASQAAEFADTQVSHEYRPTTWHAEKGDDAVHAVMLRMNGSNDELNGLYLNSNHQREKLEWQTGEYYSEHEVLMPSGQYKIKNVESKDHDGRKFITIDLVQEN